ncbi:MAG: hypothetical protein H7293_07240 [Candidatus Saccharibacteria bacterium]|nr:hypothetical protein [Rhodoferax sp.]
MSQAYPFIIADVSLETVQPLTFTHHGVNDLPQMIRGVDSEGKPLRTVFLPAGQLRGRIRHEAALAVMRGKGERVKLEEAYMLALGQDLRPEEDEAPEEIRLGDQLKLRAANPFLDLFGTWKLASRLYVSHLLPDQNLQPDVMRSIRRDLDTNEDIMNELNAEEQDRMYERQTKQSLASKVGTFIEIAERELRAAKKAKDTAKVDALEAKVAELKAQKKAQKGEDESDNTKHLVEHYVIPAGITLRGKITIQQPKASDLTALISAFNGISLKPFFGAQRARGCGEVRGKVAFRATNGEALAAMSFGDFQSAPVQMTDAGRAFVDQALQQVQ